MFNADSCPKLETVKEETVSNVAIAENSVEKSLRILHLSSVTIEQVDIHELVKASTKLLIEEEPPLMSKKLLPREVSVSTEQTELCRALPVFITETNEPPRKSFSLQPRRSSTTSEFAQQMKLDKLALSDLAEEREAEVNEPVQASPSNFLAMSSLDEEALIEKIDNENDGKDDDTQYESYAEHYLKIKRTGSLAYTNYSYKQISELEIIFELFDFDHDRFLDNSKKVNYLS